MAELSRRLKQGISAIFSFVKKLFRSGGHTEPEIPADSALPRVYARSEHGISRSQISENALKVMYRLRKAGYKAYLVGGCVRDLLLGREPKDFDVATDAHPEEVKQVFRNCRLIGRRFRLAHVHFGREVIEVATFRALGTAEDDNADRLLENGRILRDNVYGTIEEDAWRRDFTVNALYYNIEDFSVVDYVGGMADHKTGTLRVIGDPEKRYREDPVRMLRAIRFATKLGFMIHPSCADPMPELAPLLADIPAARLYDEVVKLFLSGYALQNFEQLRHYDLFHQLFPATDECLSLQGDGFPLTFVAKALENTDARVAEEKPVAPYFLFAALLWEPVRFQAEAAIAKGTHDIIAYQEASADVCDEQADYTAYPRSISLPMREVWQLQPRFNARSGGRPFRLLTHPRFRAAYDFLVLRAETGSAEPELAEWWTRFQAVGEAEQKAMASGQRTGGGGGGKKRRPRRRGPGARRLQSMPNAVTAYIGLGSNLNDPAGQVRHARQAIAHTDGISELAFSSLYRNPPMGPADQPEYVNAVMAIATTLPPHALLRALQDIENQHGRVRSGERWGPRTLDLDILLYGQQQIDTPDLTVPHPGAGERAFVLLPLLEIAPNLNIPGRGAVRDLAAKQPADTLVRL